MSSEESYDPGDDRKRTCDKNHKKARRKWLRKRKRGGPAARAGDVALKQQRRNRGEIDRSGEIQRQAFKRAAGEVDRSGEIQRKAFKRAAGEVDRSGEYQHRIFRRRKREIDHTHEAQRFTQKSRACVKSRESEVNKRKDSRAINSDPSDFSIWTSCTLPTDEQLK